MSLLTMTVTTPLSIVLEAHGVASVIAEDTTGAFGILPGHADFITTLPASVIRWRDQGTKMHYVVVRSAVLTVRDGEFVDIAAREAVGEDTLGAVSAAIRSQSSEDLSAEMESLTAANRLELAVVKQLRRYVEASRDSLHSSGVGAYRQ